MANEGSTKPTYTDYEQSARTATKLLADALSELARVRGLLQRALNHMANAMHDILLRSRDNPLMSSIALELGKAANSISTESAEIGKLDRVDEKSDDDLWMGAICAECENGDRPYQLHGEWIHALSEGDVPCPAMPVFKIVQQLNPGSAETGGEKAGSIHLNCRTDGDKMYCPDCKIHFGNARLVTDTPRYWVAELIERTYPSVTLTGKKITVGGGKAAADYFNELEDYLIEDGYTSANVVMQTMDKLRELLPTFRRSSQNQTASSGVEGAHEGTTADKSGLLPTQLPKE